ncbi:MAG: hypothetical protein BHV81_14845 [Butyricimonas synergistica]|nr:MAG: hypothetical protein BHV81_14845 [Butyricimonas synergistica]
MKIKNSITIVLFSVCSFLGITSCSDWLNVKMEDRIMENALYETNEGFLIALNGCYLEMNNVYSRNLATGVIDVMAQYYNVTENIDHTYKVYAGYKYTDASFETTNNSVWSSMYTLLANVNVVIEHCDEDGAAISGEYYPIVKGEALALRAMLHFDLLRLYGPVYSVTTAPTECIPYQMTSKREIQPLLPAEQVLNKVIEDLKAAISLLKTADPILKDGVGLVTPEDNGIADNSLSFRQLRLNYYAVQALLARAYLWQGNKNEAYQIVKNEIIDQIKEKKIFPWTLREAFEAAEKEDYMFSSEVFFALYNSERVAVDNGLFAESLSPRTRLTFVGEGLSGDSKVATFYDDDNDWRKKMWVVVEPTEEEKQQAADNQIEAKNSLSLRKYKDFGKNAKYNGADIYRYMIPLIRLSEIYLIAAECAPSASEGMAFVNEIRRHRNCPNLLVENTSLTDAITKEFAKEMIGEGQLFFYYKRLAIENFMSGTSASGIYSMILANYVWPLPNLETDKRVSISK